MSNGFDFVLSVLFVLVFAYMLFRIRTLTRKPAPRFFHGFWLWFVFR